MNSTYILSWMAVGVIVSCTLNLFTRKTYAILRDIVFGVIGALVGGFSYYAYAEQTASSDEVYLISMMSALAFTLVFMIVNRFLDYTANER